MILFAALLLFITAIGGLALLFTITMALLDHMR